MTHGTAKRLLTACLTLGAATALATTAQAQDTSQAGAAPMPRDTAPTARAGGDTLGGDSTKWGYPVDTSKPQNPPGYRGMETPTGVDSAERTAKDSGAVSDSTSDRSRTATGTATSPDSSRDTPGVGQEQPYEPNKPESRIRGDTAADSDSASQ